IKALVEEESLVVRHLRPPAAADENADGGVHHWTRVAFPLFELLHEIVRVSREWIDGFEFGRRPSAPFRLELLSKFPPAHTVSHDCMFRLPLAALRITRVPAEAHVCMVHPVGFRQWGGHPRLAKSTRSAFKKK